MTEPPEELRAQRAWVNYGDDKRPSPAINGELLSFEEARARSPRVGFVFLGNGLGGIDIDDPSTVLAVMILAWAKEAGLYVERSQSGRGFHIIGSCTHGLPRGLGKGAVDDGVEAYYRGRYFIMTGVDVSGSVLNDIQPLLDHLWALKQAGGSGRSSAESVAWDEERHASALALVSSDCSYHEWVSVGMALHAGGAPFEAFSRWSARAEGLGSDARPRYQGEVDCRKHWISFREGGGITLGLLLKKAREKGWSGGVGGMDFEDLDASGDEGPPELGGEAQPANRWERMALPPAALLREPEPRRWAWDGWVPYGVVTGLAGPPGVAKSTFCLQLCVHHVLGDALLGADVGVAGEEPGGAMFITVEDDGDELRRRVRRILSGMFLDPNVELEAMERLVLVPVSGEDVRLCTVDRDGTVTPTRALAELRATIRARGIKVLVLDLGGDYWDGNENDRGAVSAYVRGVLGGLASGLGVAVVVISHLNKAGEVSGSTAWEGSFRSMIRMTRGRAGLIEILRTKANYAPPMEAPAAVRWDHGWLAPVPAEEVEGDLDLPTKPTGIIDLIAMWGLGPRATDAAKGKAHALADQLVEEGILKKTRSGNADKWQKTGQ